MQPPDPVVGLHCSQVPPDYSGAVLHQAALLCAASSCRMRANQVSSPPPQVFLGAAVLADIMRDQDEYWIRCCPLPVTLPAYTLGPMFAVHGCDIGCLVVAQAICLPPPVAAAKQSGRRIRIEPWPSVAGWGRDDNRKTVGYRSRVSQCNYTVQQPHTPSRQLPEQKNVAAAAPRHAQVGAEVCCRELGGPAVFDRHLHLHAGSGPGTGII